MNPITLAVAGQLALTVIKQVSTFLTAGKGNSSLTDVTKSARVEPIVIVGQDCVNLEYMNDVMNSVHSIFTGYYLQAAAITANISNVRIGKILDRLNPGNNYSITKDFYSFETFLETSGRKATEIDPQWKLCAESYKYRLPVLNENKQAIAVENSIVSRTSSDLAEAISANVNLSVGKIVEITISENGQAATLPIMIRLMVSQVSERALVTMLTLRSMETSFSERFHAWRAGKISFIKDLILCQDMIDAHRKALIKDKDGALSEIIRRSNNSKMSFMFTKQVNMATASNIYIISEQTQAELESKLGGKLQSPKIREALFESGYMMILVVIDRSWERVTFYHRGITMPTTLGIRDIKNSNKGSGPDIGDILKAYQMGNSPSL